MTKLRTWGILAVVAIVAIIAGGWFLALSPQQSKASDLRDQAAQQQDANQKLQSQIALLRKQQSQIPGEQARIAQIKGRIPETPQITTYVRTLTSLAAASHVELISIAPGAPALVKLATPQQPTSAPSGAATSASNGAAAASNLSTISVAINVVGDYYNVQQFLSKLEDAQRVTIVSSVSLQPGSLPKPQGHAAGAGADAGAGSSWKTLSASVTASIFMSAAPATSAASGAGAPAGTAPQATTSPSAGFSPAPTATASN
jgi:Tfp pilus assembly protein PilO